MSKTITQKLGVRSGQEKPRNSKGVPAYCGGLKQTGIAPFREVKDGVRQGGAIVVDGV